jgi:ABC-type transport system involved in multi-copper enzyme maturation permease subunit
MRLVRAELFKIRRRTATYVVFAVALFLMVGLFLLAGAAGAFDIPGIIAFPSSYAFINQFTYGLGGLLAVVYAAAYVGADWNWGVVRNVVARGESRTNYVLAKAAALAIVLAIAVVIMYAVGVLTLYADSLLFNIPIANPLRANGLTDLATNIALGYPVLLERAALGFGVAVLLRSQVAGAVIGIVLFLGEGIVRLVLTGLSLGTGISELGDNGFVQKGPEWFQYLPVSVGDYAINAAPGNSISLGGGLEQFVLKPVPLPNALIAVAVYLVVAMAVAIVAINRQEIA